jgi:hypothetical protein
MQCLNHIKQIGIAVHNFHDINNGLPPSAIYNQKPTFWAFIYPYIEQQSLYDAMSSIDVNATNKAPFITNGTSATNTGGWFINALKGDYEPLRRAFGSVPIYHCPSHRNGASYVENSPVNDNNNGPRGDYAIVSIFNPKTESTNINANWFNQVSKFGDGSTSNFLLSRNSSPFRISNVQWKSGTTLDAGGDADKKNIVGYSFRDSFSHWRDGLSNQLCVGEKFIPSSLIDKPPVEQFEVQWDGGVINCNATHASMNSARGIYYTQSCIKRSPYDIPDDEISGSGGNANVLHAVFGGTHPGICNFLLGDGSVRGISATINWTTLWQLGKVDDGNAASLE